MAIGCLLSACDSSSISSDPSNRSRSERLPTVEAIQARYGTLTEQERLTGTARARNQTNIYSEVNGPIVAVLVNDGDLVEEGEPLVRIRDTEYRERMKQAIAGAEVAAARVKQTEASLYRVEAQLRRIQTLSDRGLTSTLELETAQADVLTAQADLDMAQALYRQAQAYASEQTNALSNTVVKAPISGIVGNRMAEVGQQATNNTPLFAIGDPNEMRVRVVLTERMLGKISTDTQVILSSDAIPELRVESRISRILPFLNPVTHTTEAEIDVHQTNGLLRPGMFVTVDLIYGNSGPTTLLPNSALYQHPRLGFTGVYHVETATEEDEGANSLKAGDKRLASVHFKPVEVVSRGRVVSGVTGVDPDSWTVTVGQYLLASRDNGKATIHATDWNHILEMQTMENRDLLQTILEQTASRQSNDRDTLTH